MILLSIGSRCIKGWPSSSPWCCLNDDNYCLIVSLVLSCISSSLIWSWSCFLIWGFLFPMLIGKWQMKMSNFFWNNIYLYVGKFKNNVHCWIVKKLVAISPCLPRFFYNKKYKGKCIMWNFLPRSSTRPVKAM